MHVHRAHDPDWLYKHLHSLQGISILVGYIIQGCKYSDFSLIFRFDKSENYC